MAERETIEKWAHLDIFGLYREYLHESLSARIERQ